MRWLSLLLLLAGCIQEHSVDITIALPASAPSMLEYQLVVGRTEEACPVRPPRDHEVRFSGEGLSEIGRLLPGRTVFSVEAWDATCSDCYGGCAAIDVGQDDSVRVVVTALSCGETACSMPGDAGPDARMDVGLDAADAADAGPDATDAGPDATDAGPDRDAAMPVVAIDIAAGYAHTCAIRADGAMFCWGLNADGQTGGTAGSVPQRVAFAEPARQIVLGDAHTCARFDDSVRCWGLGSSTFRLGSANPGTSVPTLVQGLPEDAPTDLAVGWWHSCVSLTGGAVYCWGQNAFGELGMTGGSPMMAVLAPTMLSTTQVGVGCGPSCTIGPAGTLMCWGYNPVHARLGTGQSSTSADPALVQLGGVDLVAVTAVEAGGTQIPSFGGQICAIVSGGALYCWGRNDAGQVGTPGATLASVNEPFQVPSLTSVTQVSPGGFHTCAIDSGDVYCWGANTQGQLGDGSRIDRSGVGSSVLSRATRVASGTEHSCAIDLDGQIWCWGSDSDGQLGSDAVVDRSSSTVPVRVNLPAD